MAAAPNPETRMLVREIGSGEATELGELTVAAFAEILGDDLSEAYARELGDVAGRAGETVVLVAVDPAGSLLGGITYIPDGGPWAGFAPDTAVGAAELRMLAVAPRFAGRGAGTALVEACVARARSEGKQRLLLHTTSAMVGAQRLYERLGFRRVVAFDHEIRPGLTLLGYELRLRG